MQRTGFKQPSRPERTPRAWPGVQSFAPAPRCDDVKPAMPKKPRAENRHLLDMARGRECLIRSPICVGGTATTVACHGGGVHRGKGMGYKVGDQYTAWGCYACNHYTDAYKDASKAQKNAYFAVGHIFQVLEWRDIAADTSARAKDRAAAQWALEQLNALPDVNPCAL